MKTLSFWFVLVITVVGTSVSAAVLKSLPIGKGFPGDDVKISAYIFSLDANGLGASLATYKINQYKGEGLQVAAKNVLQQLSDTFDVSYTDHSAPNFWDADYSIDIDVNVNLGRRESDYQPLANQRFPATFPQTFKLKQYPDGKWGIPTAMQVNLGYQPYMPSHVPGLKGAVLVIRKSGQEILREESENGVADKTCTLYPGKGAYYGPDVLQLHSRHVVPELREAGIEGEVTTYLSTDRKVFGTYDILTGNLIASSEPIPLQLSITRLPAGMKLSLTGSSEPVTLEYTTDLVRWKPLTNLQMVGGAGEFVDLMATGGLRIYRARQ